MNGDQDDDPEIELNNALLEFMRRYDSGEIEDREAFLKSYPEISDKLSELLATADWIESMAGPKLAMDAEQKLTPFASADEQPYDPNAETLPPVTRRSDRTISPHDSTLPPSRSSRSGGDISFGVKRLPSIDSTQGTLPCQFGDYVLHKILGRGGMGVVYLATQCNLDRQVAVKMIRSGALASKDEVNRFYAEARSAGSLAHPSIVTVYHCGEHDGHHFFSMDYIPGTDLAKLMAQGPMPVRDAVRYVLDVTRAIEYAHSRGVVHRDLKPANVLINEQGKVLLTDFGLAKRIGADEGLTATGAALGTPSYMSPEQASGNQDEQSQLTDVYAIGAILYALLVGKPPFHADSVMQTLMQVMHKPAPSVRAVRADVHPDLDTIVTKCLEKSPARRYDSARALADDLDSFYRGAPISARPPSLIRRTKHWIQNIPIFAALTGVRNLEPTPAQRWTQNGLITFWVMLLIAWLLGPMGLNYLRENRLPDSIIIASGAPGGMYFETGGELSNKLKEQAGVHPNVIPTGGSLENLTKLEQRKADLAIVQQSALRSNEVAVVAPLFYEAIHILVRSTAMISEIPELQNRKVIMGSKSSGTRQAALRLLQHFDLSEENLDIIEGDWFTKEARDQAEAMIIVIRPGLLGIAEIIGNEGFQLLDVPRANEVSREEHSFLPFEISDKHYAVLGQQRVGTLATTALLVARKDASTRLVTETLRAIYESQTLIQDIIPQRKAAAWQDLPYHDATRAYFQNNQ
ncbi:serine/threonine-protein kinase [Pirellulaceae bacterium SH449]